jgi:competence ComEA-like helix-hairpin-helix protein
MKAEWMEEHIRGWSSDLDWSTQELSMLCEELVGLGRLNGGVTYGEPALSEQEAKDWAIACVEKALDSLARSYSRYIATEGERRFVDIPTKTFKVDLPFLTPKAYAPAINVNTAGVTELEALPGLGAKTAQAVVRHRHRYGPIGSLDDLRRIAGLDAETIERIGEFAYAGPLSAQTRITSPLLDEFKKNPTFSAYVRLLVSTGMSLSRFGPDPAETPRQRVIREARGLREEQQQRAYHPYRYTPGTAAEVVRARAEAAARAEAVNKTTIADKTYGVLLDDTAYPFFVEQLLKVAAKRVRIIMFFMRYEDAAKYPTDALFRELLAAKQRRVDIRIILDQDAEGDSIKSRVVNEEAYRFFVENAIPVVYDSQDRYTHTKLVTVDGDHVVLGSHNWTAGSFHAYDDTSMYVRSTKLAAHHDVYFDALWERYGGG